MNRLRLIGGGLLWLARQFDMRDVLVFGGLGCAVYGVSGYSVPAAWITAGVVIFALGMRR